MLDNCLRRMAIYIDYVIITSQTTRVYAFIKIIYTHKSSNKIVIPQGNWSLVHYYIIQCN